MFEQTKVPAQVGMMSLVGVRIDSYPVGFGNYFSFANGLRSINMWAENLSHAAKHYLDDGMVQVDIWTQDAPKGERKWGVVVDPRLPEGYTTKVPCFTGCYQPSKEILEKMGVYYRWDQNDDYRKYTDPENYYAERGGSYKNGIIRYPVNQSGRKLNGRWTNSSKP